MASLIEGFEYDIFISYRHNDNLTGWVTDFVSALENELKSTLKDSISVYFDKNPHDGLLDTHDVDKSLEGKLKSLIFIPIISQTYCDPKSFAWHREFCTFNKMVAGDQHGRDIRLSDGNVSSRILPVMIHDIDAEDKMILEKEIGGVLRAIEFIYKEPGVNRPLKTTDIRSENHSKIDYRNQVNKVANAIKEIVHGLKSPHVSTHRGIRPARKTDDKRGLLVLPFVNMSDDPQQEYFSDGLTEEIITDLARLKELVVISRSSAMTFKGTKKKISEIAAETNVDFVLEGSVRKAGKDLRITAQLINAHDDSHVWAERYSGELHDIFGIQEKVSRSIMQALKLRLTKEVNEQIANRPIQNTQAHELYLKAQYDFYTFKEDALRRSIRYLEKALEIAGENTFLYGTLGFTYWNLYNIAGTSEINYLAKVETLITKIFDLEHDSAQGHSLKGLVAFFNGTKSESLEHLEKAYSKQPHEPTTLVMLGLAYFYIGSADKGEKVLNELGQIDPFNPIYRVVSSLIHITRGNLALALEWTTEAYEKNPEVPQIQLYHGYLLASHERREEAYAVLSRLIAESAGTIFGCLGKLLKYALQGEKAKALQSLTPGITIKLKQDCECAWIVADAFALLDEKEEALDWLESTVGAGFVNYPLFSSHDPYLQNIRGEGRFKEILERVKIEWTRLAGE